MERNKHSAQLGRGTFNTLAQNGTSNIGKDVAKASIIIKGRGSELSNTNGLKRKAKRKMIGQVLALNLMDVAKGKGNEDVRKSLWNTFHCQTSLYTVNGRSYGQYCKNRQCPLCCSIRKADIINRYFPELSKWEAPYFVTLTVRSVKKERLRLVMEKMIKGFKRINQKYRKNNQRTGSIRLIGIRSLECNFNPRKNTYNPHFHLIVISKEVAEIIKKEWLMLWKSKWTNTSAQHFRPVECLENDLIETIKYGSKIIKETELETKTKAKVKPTIYAAALYNIFEAMKGLRIFERFGFNLPNDSQKKAKGSRLVNDFHEWIFLPEYHDWHSTENELVLSAYSPPNELINLLKNNIDVKME